MSAHSLSSRPWGRAPILHASQRGQLVPRGPTWRLGQEGLSSLARVANFWPQEVANGCLPLPAKGVPPLRFCISNRPTRCPPQALLLVSSWAPFKSHLHSCHGAQRRARSTWGAWHTAWRPRASSHSLSGPKKDRQHPPFALVQLWGGGNEPRQGSSLLMQEGVRPFEPTSRVQLLRRAAAEEAAR